MAIRNKIKNPQVNFLEKEINIQSSKSIPEDRISNLNLNKYNYRMIDSVFEKKRAKNQIETWLRRIEQHPEKKSVYMSSIKKLLDFEITLIKKENKNLQIGFYENEL